MTEWVPSSFATSLTMRTSSGPDSTTPERNIAVETFSGRPSAASSSASSATPGVVDAAAMSSSAIASR